MHQNTNFTVVQMVLHYSIQVPLCHHMLDYILHREELQHCVVRDFMRRVGVNVY